MVSTTESRKAAAVAHVAITLANVRDNEPDDETCSHIAWEVVGDVVKALSVPASGE